MSQHRARVFLAVISA